MLRQCYGISACNECVCSYCNFPPVHVCAQHVDLIVCTCECRSCTHDLARLADVQGSQQGHQYATMFYPELAPARLHCKQREESPHGFVRLAGFRTFAPLSYQSLVYLQSIGGVSSSSSNDTHQSFPPTVCVAGLIYREFPPPSILLFFLVGHRRGAQTDKHNGHCATRHSTRYGT